MESKLKPTAEGGAMTNHAIATTKAIISLFQIQDMTEMATPL